MNGFSKIFYVILIMTFMVSLSFAKTSKKLALGTSSGSMPLFVTVKSNQTIPNHNHLIDYYIPAAGADITMIFLHGGGGKKESFAENLGINNDTTSISNWLVSNRVMAVFPQGQNVTGFPLATTWNNYVMNSGVDDVAFLQDLVASIRSNPELPRTSKFYLVGHSNGGMMVNRMWCESPATFDGYGSLAGPPSSKLSALGSNPCSPTLIKPYIGIVGNADTALQTEGHMLDTTWTLSQYNPDSPVVWVNSKVLNEKKYHSTRVTMKCGETVSAPVVSGQLTTYSDCNDSLKFILVSQAILPSNPEGCPVNSLSTVSCINNPPGPSGGDHCLATPPPGSSCITTLAGQTGMDYKSVVLDFLKNF